MKSLILYIFFAFLLLTRTTLAGGSSGLTFLKLDTGSRIAAMGGAATSLYHNASAVHYNPANIAGMPGSEIQLMHTSWIQGMSMQYAVAAFAMDRASLGISLYNASVDDIEVRTRPGPPEATFTARNFAAAATFAYRTSPSFRLGITGKLLYEKIFVDEATGYAFDFGFLYRTSTPGLYFGLAILNAGSMSALRDESTELPLTYRVGSSYELPLLLQDLVVQVSVDVMRYGDDDKLHLMFGGELNYTNSIFIRVGYRSGVEERGLSTGLGLRHRFLKFDYAFIPLRNNLGTGHSITVGFLL